MRTRTLLGAAVIAGTLIGTGFGIHFRHLQKTIPGRPPNILIVSVCSLRKAEVDFFRSPPAGGAKPEVLMPNVDRTFAGGFMLRNVYSSFGWTNASLYMFKDLAPRLFIEHGYEPIGDEALGMLTRIPSDRVFVGNTKVPESQFVHLFDAPMGKLKSFILQPRTQSFYAYVHFKYMHYPYIDTLNSWAHPYRYLSDAEKGRVELLLAQPGQPGSIPLKLVLSGKARYLPHGDKRTFYDLYELFADHELMAQWEREPTYQADLEIIRKIYRAKLTDWDERVADLLNLFGDERLKANTIIILTGDHGEALMEHGVLGHAANVFDETLTSPILVRFPGDQASHPRVIDGQFYQGAFSQLLRGLVRGQITAENFPEKVTQLEGNSRIISRNCSNTIHSVREENHWKFVDDAEAQAKLLYDLQADPKETRNVIDQHPDVAARLELYMIDHARDYMRIVDISPCNRAWAE